MVQILFLFIMLITIIILFFTNKFYLKPSGNMVLGATIPDSKLDDPSILDILDKFRNTNNKFLIISSLCSVPILFMNIMVSCIFLIILICLLTAVDVLLLKKHFDEIQNLKNKNSWLCTNDDDKYWWGGQLYINSNDSSFMVDKRMGFGTTVNLGNKKAKSFTIITLALTFLITAGCLFFAFRLTSCAFNISISDNNVTIDVPYYGTEFNISDISEISMISSEDLPSGSRANGASTESVDIGHFKLSGYGKSLAYIKKEQDSIIRLKLKDDSWIFLTGNSSEETKNIYEKLSK